MLTSVSVSLVAILLLLGLAVYKKEMISKLFVLNLSVPTQELTQQLEQTADAIIKRFKEEANQLTVLLEEAETKIGMLSQQVEHANKIIEQLSVREKVLTAELAKEAVKPISSITVQPCYGGDDSEQDTEENTKEDTEQMQAAAELQAVPIDKDMAAYEALNPEKYRHIIVMAEQGYTTEEIAKATGISRGEILLLLQLNKK